MRLILIALTAASLAAAPAGATTPTTSDLHHARAAYRQALQARQNQDFPGALAALRSALDYDPGNPQYLSELENLRARQIKAYMSAGAAALASGNIPEAIAQFKSALALDPANAYARQRLDDAAARLPHPQLPASEVAATLARVAQSQPVHLQPRAITASLIFTGDTRSLLTQLASTFGLTASFDEHFPSRTAKFNLQNAGFYPALEVAAEMAHAMWVPLSSSEIFFAADDPEHHRLYDRMLLRTFYLSEITAPAALNDVANTLRSVFNIHQVSVNAAQSSLTIRAPQALAEAAEQFVQNLSLARPQVMLTINAYEISHTLLRALGLTEPTQFQLINIPPSLLNLVAQNNIQQQIQQILSAGGATAASLQQINNLLAQLQQQQSSGIAGLLNEPFLTFGHGQTLFALAVPAAINAGFNFNTSDLADLKNVSLRAASGSTASLLVGERFPVLTSTFSLGTQSAGLASFPSFQFVDLGVRLKAKPLIHLPPAGSVEPGSVTLDLDLSIKGLAGTSINTVPVISNREYKGVVRVSDGEPAVIVGSISKDQERALSGIPGLGRLPLLGRLFTTTTTTNNSDDEILILVTPHLLSRPANVEQAIWLPPGVTQ